MCVDYRYLNNQTIKDRNMAPRIDDCLDQLSGAQYISKIDLRWGYWQVLMNEQDKYKTAFNTSFGQFQFRVMPFGLCNAPATFSKLMYQLFRPYLYKSVIVYMDDILIYSKTYEDHV